MDEKRYWHDDICASACCNDKLASTKHKSPVAFISNFDMAYGNCEDINCWNRQFECQQKSETVSSRCNGTRNRNSTLSQMKTFRLHWIISILLLLVYSYAEGSVEVAGGNDVEDISKASVVVLTEANFEHLTQASTGATTGDWFVKMYAPWCGHCKKLEPVWNELAGEVFDRGVNVAKVDITANRSIGERFNIKGFPTLIFMHHGQMHHYKGPRTLQALSDFASGGYTNVEPIPVPPASKMPPIVKMIKDDFQKAMVGKLPSAPTVIVLSVATFLFVLIVVFFKSKKPQVSKKTE